MAKSSTSAAIDREAKETITDRLSQIDGLYFPRKVQPLTPPTADHRKTLLLDLISSDAAVFLERYGANLTLTELDQFDVLKNDYEVNWHLNRLRSAMNPTQDEIRSKSRRIRNRRAAYMEKLVRDGVYFSEDSMREREPYLHHEYVGKFQDLSGRGMARPGERWSETLIRRAEEAVLVEKIRGEQERLGVAECDWIGNEREMEEVESESESENEAVEAKRDEVDEEEMGDRMEQFVYVMQQKFLCGEDCEHVDYGKIDEDETLDDHWMKEANRDAEEKYFDDI